MRLISQDGMIDVPYEQVSVELRDCDIWCGYYPTLSQHLISKKFAAYSNINKALKVMEMLRNAYCGLPIIMKNVDISNEVIELLKDLKKNGIIFQKVEENPSVEYVDNTYFKFPADEEVEINNGLE